LYTSSLYTSLRVLDASIPGSFDQDGWIVGRVRNRTGIASGTEIGRCALAHQLSPPDTSPKPSPEPSLIERPWSVDAWTLLVDVAHREPSVWVLANR
jgi:hypothetical protein